MAYLLEFELMLHLQEMAKQGQQTQVVVLKERLPAFVSIPCHLNAVYRVEARDNYYLIHLKTSGELSTVCQRCLQELNGSYENQTLIAVCRNDERAEQLSEFYECIVSSNGQVDLNELIVDELHLYAPLFHSDMEDCGNEVNEILIAKKGTY